MGFSAIQATRLTGCSVSQVRYWDRIGLVSPGPDGYRFEDLVALRTVCSLLEAGLPLQRIRKAIEFLRDAGEDPRGLRLVTDGVTVLACRSDGEVLDALQGGQLALFVSVDAVAGQVEADVKAFEAEREAFVDALAPDEDAGATGTS